MKKIFTLFLAALAATATFAQTPRLVLFEEFSGENCPPCAYTNPFVYSLVDANPAEVVLLKYQCNIPSPGNLYYTDETDVNYRLEYYGVNSAPWGEQDGIIWDSSLLVGTNASGYQPLTWAQDPGYLNDEYRISAPFTVAVTQTITGSSDSFYAQVVIAAPEAYAGGPDLKLRVAMVEDLLYPMSEGHNGETQFQHVLRKMYPSTAGTAIDSVWTSGQSQTFTFQGKLPTYIRDKSKIRFVAFVQNDANKHVEQAGVSQPTVFNIDASANEIIGLQQNCSNQYTAFFSFTNVGSQTLSSGQFVISIDNHVVDSVPWGNSVGSLAPGDSTVAQLPAFPVPFGQHTITIATSSPNGQVDQNAFNNAASIVMDVTDSSATVPLSEGFETGLPDNWAVQNNYTFDSWQINNSVGDSSTHSYWINFYNDIDLFFGATSILYAPALNLSNARHATLTFDYAYSPLYYGPEYGWSDDSLFVEISPDCGYTWIPVWENGSYNLASFNYNDEQPAAFTPTAAQWVYNTIDISAVAQNESALLRFRAVYGEGNNLYLDNINVTDYDFIPSSVQKVSSDDNVQLYPNPATNTLNINLALSEAAHLSYKIIDVNGQTLLGSSIDANAGQNMYSINTGMLASGTYFLTLNNSGIQTSRLFSIIH